MFDTGRDVAAFIAVDTFAASFADASSAFIMFEMKSGDGPVAPNVDLLNFSPALFADPAFFAAAVFVR
jgi:hypothetical protein